MEGLSEHVQVRGLLFSLDPRETKAKAQPVIYFGPEKVPFESNPRHLGVTLDCQLTFGSHTDELKKKLTGRLKVLRCLSGRSWGWSESVITQVTILHLCTVLYLILRIIMAGIHRYQSPPQARVPTPRRGPDHHWMH